MEPEVKLGAWPVVGLLCLMAGMGWAAGLPFQSVLGVRANGPAFARLSTARQWNIGMIRFTHCTVGTADIASVSSRELAGRIWTAG